MAQRNATSLFQCMNSVSNESVYLNGPFSLFFSFILVNWLVLNGSLSYINIKDYSIPNAISRPIRTYFKRWLIRTNSYDLTRKILYD